MASYAIDPQKVKLAAMKQCMTLASVRKKAGLPGSTFYKAANGEGRPRLSTIGKIARALNVEPQELLKA